MTPTIVKPAQAAFGQLLGLVEAAQRDGFRPDAPATRLASVVWAAVHGLSQLALQGALGGAGGAELDPTLDLDERAAARSRTPQDGGSP